MPATRTRPQCLANYTRNFGIDAAAEELAVITRLEKTVGNSSTSTARNTTARSRRRPRKLKAATFFTLDQIAHWTPPANTGISRPVFSNSAVVYSR
jgi:hypothetical protein